MIPARTYFGTDGIRGPVDGPCLNDAFVGRLGVAVGRWLKTRNLQGEIIIGRDTRASGLRFTQCLAGPLTEEGFTVLDAGVVPTPAVALAVRQSGACLGVMVTASHNPASDNGIKFFDADGYKLNDREEAELERFINEAEAATRGQPELPALDARGRYESLCESLLGAGSLQDWRIVVDTANGATFQTTPAVLRALGATVYTIGAEPDGHNINAGCGSEHPEALAAAVQAQQAQIGIAHDGDGDRLVLCDEQGQRVNGDALLAMIALRHLREGILAGDTLVATQMSNLGLDEALEAEGGKVLRTAVGDRYVLEAMRQAGFSLGGESSGHIISRRCTTTGDGLVAALEVIRVLLQSGQPLSRASHCLRLFPQGMRNLKVREKIPMAQLPELTESIARLEAGFAGKGRILVRYSGTEPKIRLLVEGPEGEAVESVLADLEAAVRKSLEVVA